MSAIADMPAEDSNPSASDLADRVEKLIDAVSEALGESVEPSATCRDLDSLDAALGKAAEAVVSELDSTHRSPSRTRALAPLLIELTDRRLELSEYRTDSRLEAFARIQEGLSRLRARNDVGRIVEGAPETICETCGFDRVVVSSVRNSCWTVQAAHFSGEFDWAKAFVAFSQVQAHPYLDHMILETEMVRRRQPAMVVDAMSDERTYKPLIESADVHSYVAAPIIQEGSVVGFLHADHYFSDRPVDHYDRGRLWAFAEGLSHVLEGAVRLERMRDQGTRVRRILRDAEAVIDEFSENDLQLASFVGEPQSSRAGAETEGDRPQHSRLEDLLTRRELEVLALMASGETNAGVAERLVISKATVKTHVKNILRKLRASNRTEAVSRFLRLTDASRRQ